MRRFPHTATKVFTWRSANEPERPLTKNDFTINDVLDGRVFGFYDDMDENEKKCSVSLAEPEDHHGALFLGDQSDVEHLHWYNLKTLMRMLPNQKLDPDTLIPWGDFSKCSDKQLISRIRSVMPLSNLNRMIANGSASANLQALGENYRQNNMSIVGSRSDRNDINLLESYMIRTEFHKAIQRLDPNHNTSGPMIFRILDEILHFSLMNLIQTHHKWCQSRGSIKNYLGWTNNTNLEFAMSIAVLAVRAFVHVMYPHAPILHIVANDVDDDDESRIRRRIIYLDAPFADDETPRDGIRLPFHCVLNSAGPSRRRSNAETLNLSHINISIINGHAAQ